ncbi:MAG: hypothetical protein RIK87_17385 [Fuerstiella sp.]
MWRRHFPARPCIAAVSASMILLAAGSFGSHDQTQVFLQLTGSAIGLIGLAAWFRAFGRLPD